MCPAEPLSQGKVLFSKQAGCEQGRALHSQAELSPQSCQAARDNRVSAVWQGHAVHDGTVSPGEGEAAGCYWQISAGEDSFGS